MNAIKKKSTAVPSLNAIAKIVSDILLDYSKSYYFFINDKMTIVEQLELFMSVHKSDETDPCSV